LFEALALYERLGDPAPQPNLLRIIGAIYGMRLGNYPEAFAYLFRSLELSQTLQDRGEEMYSLAVLGGTYGASGDLPTALPLLQRAAQLAHTQGDFVGEAITLNNLAMVLGQMRQYPDAVRTGKQALRICEAQGLPAHKANTLDTLGNIYLDQGEPAQAIPYLQQSIAVARTHHLKANEIVASLNLAKADHAQGAVDAALTSARQALTLAQDTGDTQKAFECHQFLAQVYEQQGEFALALRHYQQFHTLQQTVFNEQADLRIKTLQVIHETETAKKDAEMNRRRADELHILADVGREISATLDLTAVMEMIVARAKALLHANTAAIFLQQPEAQTFRPVVVLGHEADAIQAIVVTPGIGIAGAVAQTGVAELVNDVDHDSRAVHIPNTPAQDDTVDALLCAPLKTPAQVIGLLLVWRNPHEGVFTPQDLDFLVSLSQQAAVAIHNAQLFEEAQQAKDAALEAQRAAEAAQRASEAANQAKSEFLACMSHELRTPLNAILGYAQILQRSPETPPQVKESVEIIAQSGTHLLTLINDILDLSKIEARKLELEPLPLHLPAFLTEVVEIIRMRADQKDLCLTYVPAPTLPAGILADEKRLRQVLLNLLGNAVKFTERGGVTFRILDLGFEILDLEKGGQSKICTLKFTIEDTGMGIAPEQLGKLFQPFEQIRDRRYRAEGTGLGLAISRRLVQLMGSDIQVSSEPGKGTTFWFEMALPVVDISQITSAGPARAIIGYKGRRRTALVVDDNTYNRLVLANMLTPLGFVVAEAASGAAAVSTLQELAPDVILLDLVMPGMPGVEAAQAIRATPAGRTIPIIAVSATLFSELPPGGKPAGWDAFVPKPVNIDDLLAALQSTLNLTWIEQDAVPDEQRPVAEPGAPLIAPPSEVLRKLHHLVLLGDMAGIIEYIARFEGLDATWQPFARKVQQLTRAYRDEDLLHLLEAHLNHFDTSGQENPMPIKGSEGQIKS
jgi:signal transduction histidine kinase/DNA-binding NarL/FixJ family response regulator